MQKEHIYYAIIGLGLLSAVVIGCIYLWPDKGVPAAPVLERTILGDSDEETKREAAKDFASHGPAARLEVRRSIQQYNGDDPKVKISLIDATAKNLDWRSVPELFEAMESPYPVVRARAAAAAEKIMGLEFFYRADAPADERARILGQMREEYEAMEQIKRFQDVYTDQTE